MIRVLFVNHSTVIGGAETNLLNILRYCREGGFEPVGVLLPDDGPLAAEVRKIGIDVGQIRYHAFHWRNPFRYAQTMAQLLTWIRRTGPTVIHLNHQWLVSHVVQAGIITRTPVVCHVRNFLNADFVSSQRRWLNKVQAIIVESRAVEHRVLELGLPQKHVHLIYNGVDRKRFHDSDSRTVERSPGSVIGFSGRIVPEKGPEDLIRGMPLVLKRVPAARLCFLGQDQEKGAYVERLKSLALQLGVQGSVTFLGFRRDSENVLRDFDVLAIPSRKAMPEGLPLTMLEGLAAGCLVVATPNSGVPEAIHHGDTGFLVAFENPEALAAGIIEALTLPNSVKQRIRNVGKELVVSQFSIERQVTQLGRVFQDLVT